MTLNKERKKMPLMLEISEKNCPVSVFSHVDLTILSITHSTDGSTVVSCSTKLARISI